jgi:hypothetical protein
MSGIGWATGTEPRLSRSIAQQWRSDRLGQWLLTVAE